LATKNNAQQEKKNPKFCSECGWLTMEWDEEIKMWRCSICHKEVKFVRGGG